jgi:nucleoid DNA-binding protein
MNKAELVKSIAKELQIKKLRTKQVIDAFIKTTSTTLSQGEKVVLGGLGSFTPYKRKARLSRNPKTGKSVEVPQKKAVKFKQSETLLK